MEDLREGIVLCLSAVCNSRSKTGLELGDWFYTTDCDTAVLVVFSCTVDTEVYTCVLLVCNSWKFKDIGL